MDRLKTDGPEKLMFALEDAYLQPSVTKYNNDVDYSYKIILD